MRKEERQSPKKFVRALLLLAAFIFGGLFLVEAQLNDLTKESDFAKVLNIRRSQAERESVELYVLGEAFIARREDYAAAAARAEAYWDKAQVLFAELERQAQRYYTEFF